MKDSHISSEELTNQTIEYYDQLADTYLSRTQSLDMSSLYKPFIERLPNGAHILDAGCGSGRDSLAFKQMGYSVTAMDASATIVAYVSALLAQPGIQVTFQEMDFQEEFDAIWACASLLHIPRTQIMDVVRRFARALKPGGIFYSSFKYGNSDEFRDGRLFSDYDEHSFSALIAKFSGLTVVDIWTTKDVRPEKSIQWLNAIVRKTRS